MTQRTPSEGRLPDVGRPRPRRRRRSRLAPAALVAVLGVVAAACGTGDSVNDAGLGPDDDTESTADVTTPSDDTVEATGPTGPSTDEDDGVDGSEASTTDAAVAESTAPATTAVPVADLPPCPVDALDAADGPVEVSLWFGFAGDLPAALQSLADEYNASQDRVVVSIENQTDYESVVDKFVEFDVEDRPELVLAPEFVTQFLAQSDLFIPVESCISATDFDTSSFLPAALNEYSFEGARWGLAFNASSPVLYYNRKMFEAAGLDPDDPPVTFEELRAAAQQLIDSGASANGLVVDHARDAAIGGASLEHWFGRLGEPYVNNGNGHTAPATEVEFDTSSGVEMLTFLQGMVRDGLAVSVGENAGGQAGLLKLADQQEPAAMVVGTSAALGTVIAALGGGLIPGLTADDVGVGPLPGPTAELGAHAGGAAFWLPAGKGDVAAAAAWDFIQFAVSAQSQSTWADATGYFPVRSDAVELDPVASRYGSDPRWRVAYDQVVAVPDDPLSILPVLGPQREVRQQVADAIARVYSDPTGADPAAELAAAAEAANGLIENYNALND